jgi:hypothetical protein
MNVKLSLELQKKIRDLIGGDKYSALMKLIQEYGIIIVDGASEILISLPKIEISAPFQKQLGPVRRFQFHCKINGQELNDLTKIELDPFDYSDGNPLEVRLTVKPGGLKPLDNQAEEIAR